MRLAVIVTLSFLTVAAYGQQTRHVPAQYLSIQAAVNTSSAGDTIVLAPGFYQENVVTNHGLSFIGSGGASVTTWANASGSNTGALTISGTPNQSASVVGIRFLGPGAGIQNFNPLATFSLTDCTFDGLSSANAGAAVRISTSGAAGEVYVVGCTFINNAGFGGAIVQLDGTGPFTGVLLSNCNFRSNYAWGQLVRIIDSSPGGSIVENTAVTDNFSGAFLIGGGTTLLRSVKVARNLALDVDVSISTAVSATFEQCLITDAEAPNGWPPIQWGNGALLFRNSTLITRDLGAILPPTGSTATQQLTISSSLVKTAFRVLHSVPGLPTTSPPIAASFSVFDVVVPGFNVGSGNLVTDSLLTLSEPGDYHLAWNSPCRDAGDTNATNLPATDFDGTPRVVGAAIDIGCDEIPAQQFPGTGEDLDIYVKVNEQGDPLGSSATAAPGDLVHVLVRTPGGTFAGTTFLLAGEVGPTGYAPYFDPFFPAVHLYPTQAFVLAGATNTGPFASPGLPPQGMDLYYQIPPGLAGFTIRLQGFAITAFSANGIFACSNARDVNL